MLTVSNIGFIWFPPPVANIESSFAWW